jgi:ribulose-phosphate 3-epimerase
MKTYVEVVPTVVPDSLDDVARSRTAYAAFATALHVDAADGIFAPNKTWVPGPGELLPDAAGFMYEAHMMVATPLATGVAFARAGAKRIIGHIEAFQNAECAREAFAMWKGAGASEVGIGVLMKTPLEALVPYISICDSILFMTIASIGTQGIPFDPRGVERVAEFHKRYPHVLIAVDGGVNKDTAKALAKAGARRLSVGSAIQKSTDPAAMYKELSMVPAAKR